MSEGKIIFIVGNSRSGTTMLGRILGGSSKVYTFGELHFFEHQVSAEEIINKPARPEEDRLQLLERLFTSSRDGFFYEIQTRKYRNEAQVVIQQSISESCIEAYEQFLHYESQKNGKSIPCEQTPRYLYFAREILDVFPNAVIINMVRDPRDVLLSQKNKWRRRFLGAKNIPLKEAIRAWVNYHPWIISRLWVSAVSTSNELEGQERYVTIRFEDLVQMPEKTIKSLCDHVGVAFEKDMMEVPQVGSSAGSDRPDQKGIDSSRTHVWKNGGLSDTEIHICQQATGSDMRMHGYELVDESVSKWKVAGSMMVLFVKGAMALLMNLSRTKNLRETLKRRFNRKAV